MQIWQICIVPQNNFHTHISIGQTISHIPYLKKKDSSLIFLKRKCGFVVENRWEIGGKKKSNLFFQ